jgi:hypothetical protein
MKELLREFFASILGEAAKKKPTTNKRQLKPRESPDYPGFFHVAGGYYSQQKDGEITHKKVKGQKNLVALAAKEKAQKNATKKVAVKKVATKKAPVKKKTAQRPKSATSMSQTKRPGKVTSSDVDSVRAVYPDARRISVIDTIQEQEITDVMDEMGIPTGEGEVLPADLGSMQRGYGTQGLDGHYNDKNYYQRMKSEGRTVRTPPFKMPPKMVRELNRRGFPTKYIELLERVVNVQAEGEEPRFSDMISGVGAGQNSSQFGEVMSMAIVAIPPELREEFAIMMKQQIQESKLNFLKQQLGAAEFKKLQQDEKEFAKALRNVKTVGDDKWIDAAVGHAAAFDSYMDEMYGKGRWKLEGAAWDRKSDIEQLGLDYANKGFSTDAMFRVQPLTSQGKPKGPAQAVRSSLKKDENVMLFNGGVGEIKNLVRTSYLPPAKRQLHRTLEQVYSLLDSKKSKKERDTAINIVKRLLKIDGDISYEQAKKLVRQAMDKIDSDARENAPPHVRNVLDRVANFSETQKGSALKMGTGVARDGGLPTSGRGLSSAIESAVKLHTRKGWSEKELTNAYKIVKGCSKAKDFEQCLADKVGGAADRISKVCTLAAAVTEQLDNRYKKQFFRHLSLATNLGRDYLALFSRDNPEMLASLMGVLKEKFPMGVVMGGGEMMIINGTHVGARTLQTVFGVESYDELQLGLKLIEVDGEVMLAYEGKGKNARTVVIGAVDCRQKGAGYAAVGFEIKCSEQFVLEAARANSENGTTSDANAQAIKRIEGKISGRSNRGK